MRTRSILALLLLPLLWVSACIATGDNGSSSPRAEVTQTIESLRQQVQAEKTAEANKGKVASEEAADEPPAEQARKAEQEFRSDLSDLDQAVKSLESRVAEYRRLVAPPTRADIERLNQDLDITDRAMQRIAIPSPSSLAQLEAAELRDRLFELRLAVGMMTHRWGDGWKVFGMDFFANAAIGQTPEPPTVPDNYTIRVGDKLQVAVSSSIGDRTEYELTVDHYGRITVAGIGKVLAAGRKVSLLRQELTSKLRSRFKQLSAEVSVIKTEAVRVQVGGEVARPGPYAMSSVATVFSALSQAGGPTKSGTFRRISLVRAGHAKRTIDLYKFLVKGENSDDLPLQEGDLIFVPPVAGTIVIGGEVVRPARYEPDFPLTLAEALKLAGGPSAAGYLQAVQVERVMNGEYRVLLDSPSAKVGPNVEFMIQPGDQITVKPVRLDRTNQVAITGPVGSPGLFGFSAGMRVSDLIKSAQGLAQDREVYGGRADILRTDPLKGVQLMSFDLDKALKNDPEQNIPLQRLDQVFVYEPEQVVYKPRLVTVLGAVAKQGTYKRLQGMSVSDAIAAAGGVAPDAYLTRADLVRHRADGTDKLIRIDLESALTRNPGADVQVEDRDVITIYTNDDASWSDRTVRVEGSVQRPGVYNRSEGMQVSDLLLACGGLLPEAAKTGEVGRWTDREDSQIIKVDLAKVMDGSVEDPVLRDRDVLTVPKMNLRLRSPEIVFLSGEVARPGPYTLHKDEKLVDLIDRAGGLTDSADRRGLMFLRQKAVLENPQQIKDVDLILNKSRVFADKQFVTSLAKLGISLPTQYVEAVQSSSDKLAKPVEVVHKDERGQNATSTSPAALQQLMSEPTAREKETASALGPRIAQTPDVGELDLSMFQGRRDLAQLATSARISVDLERAFKDVNAPDNIPLRGGDHVDIPRKTDVVTVIGAVLHPHAFAAGTGGSVQYFIERSGGFAMDAAKGSVVVVRSNGDALPASRARSAEPGDVIVVPTTGLIDIAKKWERINPVTKVISDVLSSVYILTRF